MIADGGHPASWVLWTGQHALPVFLAALGVVLAATGFGWRAMRRAFHAPAPSLPLRTAIGIGIALAGVGAFAAMAVLVAAPPVPGWSDQAFTDVLRAHAPQAALQAFAALTHFGDTLTRSILAVAIALALVACGQRGLALGWVVAMAGNGVLNRALKEAFGRARPLNPEGLVLEAGFSFPSGHSSGAVVAYGMLAYLALRLLPARWQLPCLLAAVALALSVGASRVFLGVHFVTDVIAGLGSGSAWLALCITSIELMRARRRDAA